MDLMKIIMLVIENKSIRIDCGKNNHELYEKKHSFDASYIRLKNIIAKEGY